jgi:D-alanine-D-alanine ligase
MKIGVLMGGISSEREISLLSGQAVVDNLDKNKYEILPIIINNKEEVIEKVKGVDFVFLALHGAFGEDGTVQGILESISMPYSGCNLLTSALCMDKKQSKRILNNEGIRVPAGVVVKANEELPMQRIESLGYPVVVKPNTGGSSIATFLVNNEAQLKESVAEALKYDHQVLVEQYLSGNEYTICILNGEILPILFIKAKGEFFDFHSKYTTGGAEEIIVPIPAALEQEMIEIGKKCWEIFDCKAYVRVDIMVSEDRPYVLELNTLPGLTMNSLFPKSAKAVNLEYGQLLDKIIEYSLA